MTSQGFVSVPGGRLYAEAVGDPSNPALLFIHAGVADCAMWDPQVEFFAPSYRVIRFDTRGFGKTQTEDVAFSNPADAAAVLDHFGVEHIVVIGCSRGGQIAIDFTLEFPRRVRALVPVASGPSGYPFVPPDTELSRLIAQSFEAMEAAETARDFVKLTDLEVRLWGDGPNQPEGRMAAPVREKMRAMIRNTYSTRTTEGKPIALDPPAYGRLGEISVPTLIVEGDLDLPSIAEMADAMQRLIPHAQQLTMHGAAHLPSMEQPDAFNRALQDFLTQHGLRRVAISYVEQPYTRRGARPPAQWPGT